MIIPCNQNLCGFVTSGDKKTFSETNNTKEFFFTSTTNHIPTTYYHLQERKEEKKGIISCVKHPIKFFPLSPLYYLFFLPSPPPNKQNIKISFYGDVKKNAN